VTVGESGEQHTVTISQLRDVTAYIDFAHQVSQSAKIPQRDLIILGGPAPYKSYPRSLPPKGEDIFVYDRRSLQPEDSLPPPRLANVARENVTVQLPRSTPSSGDFELEQLKAQLEQSGGLHSPLHSALPTYERNFMLILSKGKRFEEDAAHKIRRCGEWLNCRRQQNAALRAAVVNLQDHFGSVEREFSKLSVSLKSQHATSSRLLEGFNEAMGKLSSIQLHPNLQTDTLRTLRDCIPSEKYEPFVSQCRVSQQKLADATQEITRLFDKLKGGVAAQVGRMVQAESDASTTMGPSHRTSPESPARGQAAVSPPAGATPEPGFAAQPEGNSGSSRVEPDKARMLVNRARRAADDQHLLVEKVQHDYVSVRAVVFGKLKELLAVVTSPIEDRGSGSVMLRGAVDGLEEKHEKAQSQYLPEFQRNHEVVCEAYVYLAEEVDDGTRRLRDALREVSLLQQGIVDFKKGMKLRVGALKQQREDFMHLEIVHSLPSMYRRFIAEVQRRQAAADEFELVHRRCVSQLQQLYDEEIEARESFIRSAGSFLPPCFSTFLPSLYHKPPKFKVDRGSNVAMPDLTDPPQVESDTPAERGVVAGPVIVAAADVDDGDSDDGDPEREVLRLRMRVAKLQQENERLKSGLDRAPHHLAQADTAQDQEASSQPANQYLSLAPGAPGVDELLQLATTVEQLVPAMSATKSPGAEADSAAETGRYMRSAGGQCEAHAESTVEEENATVTEAAAAAAAAAAAVTTTTTTTTTTTVASSSLTVQTLTQLLHRVLVGLTAGSAQPPGALQPGLDAVPKREMISFLSFEAGDVALFLPVPRPNPQDQWLYLAFNQGCPRHYLAAESAKYFVMKNNSRSPNYIVGRIVFKERHEAGERGDQVANPFDMKRGTVYWILHIVSIEQ